MNIRRVTALALSMALAAAAAPQLQAQVTSDSESLSGSTKTAPRLAQKPGAGPTMPAGASTPAAGPAFSGAVMAGDTLYVSGTTDMDRATGKSPSDPKVGAKTVMDNIKRTVESGGLTMDDLV